VQYSAALMRYLNTRIQSCYCAPMICFFAPHGSLVLKPPRIFFGALNNCDITPDGTLSRDRVPATKMSCGGRVSVGGVLARQEKMGHRQEEN
jgi:hypothetical protein